MKAFSFANMAALAGLFLTALCVILGAKSVAVAQDTVAPALILEEISPQRPQDGDWHITFRIKNVGQQPAQDVRVAMRLDADGAACSAGPPSCGFDWKFGELAQQMPVTATANITRSVAPNLRSLVVRFDYVDPRGNTHTDVRVMTAGKSPVADGRVQWDGTFSVPESNDARMIRQRLGI